MNIQDSFLELDKMLEATSREHLRNTPEADVSQYHLDLGLWLRNNWGLWSKTSRLKQYFDENSVHDADEMTNVIITSYWHYLNGRSMDWASQIVYNKVLRDSNHSPNAKPLN